MFARPKMNRRALLAAAFAVAALTPVLISGCGSDDDDGGNQLTFATGVGAGQEIPQPTGNPTANGNATLRVSDDGSTIFLDAVINGGAFTSAVTAAHIHIITNANGTGPVVFPLFNSSGGATFTIPGEIHASFTAADYPPGGIVGIGSFADAVALIRQGLSYINFHTTVNPSGEIRGNFNVHNQGGGS